MNAPTVEELRQLREAAKGNPAADHAYVQAWNRAPQPHPGGRPAWPGKERTMTEEVEVHRWDVLDRDGERFDGVTAPTEERAQAVVRSVYPGKPFTLAPARRK